MPSDNPLTAVDWAQRTEPTDLPEWMDEPCSLEELRTCLHDLGQVNRLTLGYRPTIGFLDRILTKRMPASTLRILDVGFGGGDTLHQIDRWAKQRGIAVELTGIDLNPHAAIIAANHYGTANIHWLTGDALAYEGEADIIISSLLTHHLSTSVIAQFLRWMEQTATVGWFINDLERSAQSAKLFAMLARVMRWHRFVRHDGPVSFARAFIREDWQRMLVQSGVPVAAVEISRSFPSRLCIGRIK